MAKPETYKGADGVKIKCLRDYTVRGGSGAGAEDVEFKAGQTYTLAPRSAAHMLRKTYRAYGPAKDGKVRGPYLGDAPHFVDEKAAKEMANAEAAAKKAADGDAGGADGADGGK